MDLHTRDVVWDSPSDDSLGSMPLGNGDLGANVWVTRDGRVHLYLGKTDAWDEYSRLVKLGELTIEADPPAGDAVRRGFRQALHPSEGCIVLRFGPAAASVLELRLWVDAHRPMLWIEVSGGDGGALPLRCRLGTWRTAYRQLDAGEAGASMRQDGVRDKAFEYPDAVLSPPHLRDGQIGLYHRNQYSMLPELLAHQQLADAADAVDDPLVDRTFGCVVQCDADEVETGGELAEQTLTCRAAAGRTVLAVVAHTSRDATLDAWAEALQQHADAARGADLDAARRAHADWWRALWDRSFIEISGSAAAEAIGRACALQRYVTACAGRGTFPIKFNGSIFTVDGPEENRPDWDAPRRFNPDYRRWGGGYWFQNTRLIYWPLLASGDWEMLRPWFDFFERVAGLSRRRVAKHLGMDGVFFPETMTLWGTYRNDNYGYGRPADLNAALPVNRFIRRYWQGGLELAAVMLAYRSHTGDDAWWRRQGYPIVRDVLLFYRAYYDRRDARGKVRLAPSQALETWHDAVNPTPDIAGLRWVLDELLRLPDPLTPDDDRPLLRRFRDELPDVPLADAPSGAGPRIVPAETYRDCRNMENCSLYAVFPYPLGALGGPLVEHARRAWGERRMKKVGGWMQDAVHAAMLGLTDEAADCLTAALAPDHATGPQLDRLVKPQQPHIRFEGFFGPNFDWVPDQDHGCVNVLAVQKMCLQTQHGKLRLLPAWPRDWNVHFRLRAPRRTTVEADYRRGRLVELSVDPPERRADVILPEWLSAEAVPEA